MREANFIHHGIKTPQSTFSRLKENKIAIILIFGLCIVLALLAPELIHFNLNNQKIMNNQETQAYKTYGGPGMDWVLSLIQTTDGGYAFAGITDSSGAGGEDMWLVKTDGNGVAQWNRTYGGVGMDRAFSLLQTTDGGFALAGSTNSFGAGGDDMWLVKTDGNGVTQWNRTYGGIRADGAWVLLQTVDEGFALAGSTNSSGAGRDAIWLVKTDGNGVTQWNRTYRGSGRSGVSALQTMDGDFVLAYNNPEDPFFFFGFSIFIVKTDEDGITRWNQTIPGLFFFSLRGPPLIETMDGGIALAGVTDSDDQEISCEIVVIKMDDNGIIQWNTTYNGTERRLYLISSLLQTTDGRFLLAGVLSDDVWLMYVNTEQTTELKI
jgi:hypothetical protein